MHKYPPFSDAAKEYAEQGYPVFPLVPREKKPLTQNGFKDSTTSIATIDAWWQRNPNANIGIPTGKQSGFWVLDIDGSQGEAWLKENVALPHRHGKISHFFIQLPESHIPLGI